MTRSEVLQTAEKMVTGQREQDYGKPENNFEAIAAFWNVYLEAIDHTALNAVDVAMMMAMFKEARIATGTGTDDSFVDACGYLACGAELNSLENLRTV